VTFGNFSVISLTKMKQRNLNFVCEGLEPQLDDIDSYVSIQIFTYCLLRRCWTTAAVWI